MEINWRAVITGFLTAFVLGLLVAWIVPPMEMSGLAQAFPGLVGGFVAGYMVVGAGRGAVHGGLATVLGGLVLLIVLGVAGTLFAGVIPALTGFALGLFVLIAQAIPGAIAGAIGGWVKGRREPTRETTETVR
ncbi:DUF5518 domain-containing protein [Haladaptatus sp. DFWS20]|uniref:DUF5518 domain-containing protein n=1 Tax=Haladaptatus sp. DFWS20 TaxID=3403467 RepID=UPI003EC0C432